MGKHILKYPHRNIQTARMLRKRMTVAEQILWSRLRSKQLGAKFRRQVPYGRYIADFLSLRPKLVVELDGIQHHEENAQHRDQIRDKYFTGEGFIVLRFNNSEIFENIESVLEKICEMIRIEKQKELFLCLPNKGKNYKKQEGNEKHEL